MHPRGEQDGVEGRLDARPREGGPGEEGGRCGDRGRDALGRPQGTSSVPGSPNWVPPPSKRCFGLVFLEHYYGIQTRVLQRVIISTTFMNAHGMMWNSMKFILWKNSERFVGFIISLQFCKVWSLPWKLQDVLSSFNWNANMSRKFLIITNVWNDRGVTL